MQERAGAKASAFSFCTLHLASTKKRPKALFHLIDFTNLSGGETKLAVAFNQARKGDDLRRPATLYFAEKNPALALHYRCKFHFDNFGDPRHCVADGGMITPIEATKAVTKSREAMRVMALVLSVPQMAH